MPSCHRNFHPVCIDVWLQKQTTCPICRLPLNESLEAASSLHEDQTEGNHEVSGDQYNRWLLPSGQRSERSERSINLNPWQLKFHRGLST
ncbi:RING-H2 finger protein [Musa troglodytarum]|nr:RING-H2 finger protein [Musa troglodytarum]